MEDRTRVHVFVSGDVQGLGFRQAIADKANEQGVTQYNSTADDIDLTGSSITITSDQTATCDQTLNQAAAAGK